MIKKNPKILKIICAATALITAVSITGCSCGGCNGCNGISSLFGLVSGGGEATTAAAASTETTAAASTTTAAASETTTAKESATTKPSETTTAKPPETTKPESTTEHVHDWHYNWEDPATCTDDGADWYICSKCGAEYYDAIPALGHDWERTGGSPPDCTHDGGKWYTCMRCGEEYVEVLPALGHNMNGYTSGGMGHTRCCDMCGLEYPETFEAHDYEGSCKPKPGEETIYHVYYCKFCGYIGFQDVHHMTGDGICVDCGYSGPVG
ncbi:MAG: hypothetical protein E7233_01905 [Lachnospiraceae bacterium]|nr:hypothetical protein [Lachnospiraceae bacterium]